MAQGNHYTTLYRRMEVQTADQFELVLILYKGAISSLRAAQQGLKDKNVEKRVNGINRSIAMIGELQAALDFEKGGTIAASLNRLYNYMLQRLSLANSRQENAPIEEVIGLLSTLHSAWAEARELHNGSATPSLATQETNPAQAAVR
jgi:flagellar protein FliS